MAAQVKISANGRISIPADVRARLGLKDGDTLSFEETEEGLVFRTLEQRVRRAQALSRRLLAGKPNVTVDDFIAEKRADVLREEARDRELHGD
jgi:AbrB family looped-hinge helix DNA binding protein